jgi:hypothetical protein
MELRRLASWSSVERRKFFMENFYSFMKLSPPSRRIRVALALVKQRNWHCEKPTSYVLVGVISSFAAARRHFRRAKYKKRRKKVFRCFPLLLSGFRATGDWAVGLRCFNRIRKTHSLGLLLPKRLLRDMTHTLTPANINK